MDFYDGDVAAKLSLRQYDVLSGGPSMAT